MVATTKRRVQKSRGRGSLVRMLFRTLLASPLILSCTHGAERPASTHVLLDGIPIDLVLPSGWK